jgi:Domain of unknown function (DUF4062)
VPFHLPVFISSRVNELLDLRDGLRASLLEFGLEPFLSETKGFPNFDGVSPHVSCLKVLEQCPLVVGLLDKTLGDSIEDWGPYSAYNGLAPTEAEFKHALISGKRLMIFIRRETKLAYESWIASKKNDSDLAHAQKRIFELLSTMGEMKISPWIRDFQSTSDLTAGLKENLINELYLYFKESEKQKVDQANYLMSKIEEAEPGVRSQIEEKISPDLMKEKIKLQEELERLWGVSNKQLSDQATEFERKEQELLERISTIEKELGTARFTIGLSIVKDVAWLQHVRMTLQPKQPGRVPFHNSAEVASRGFNTANSVHSRPNLLKVTWSKLLYRENNLHRGYYAGLIFYGSNFPPGVTYTSRQIGSNGPLPGQSDYFWRQPNIYFGDYLETSTTDDEFESPLSWRRTEFCVRSPEGLLSDWILFSYEFDFPKLENILFQSIKEAEGAIENSRYEEATEPLRKAGVFADRLDNVTTDIKSKILALREALKEKLVSSLPFLEGDKLRIIAGAQKGFSGEVVARNPHGYIIEVDGKRYTVRRNEVQK